MITATKKTDSTTFLSPEHWDAMLKRIRREDYLQLIQQFRDANNPPIARKDFHGLSDDMPVLNFQESIRNLNLGIRFLRKDILPYHRRQKELEGKQRFYFVLRNEETDKSR